MKESQMSEIEFKEFSDEENRIYEEAIEKIRGYMSEGMHIDAACEKIEVDDANLKQLISEDFLKIMIAEMHYEKGIPLEIVAKELNLPFERVSKTHQMMLEEVGHTQAQKMREQIPDILDFQEPKGNA